MILLMFAKYLLVWMFCFEYYGRLAKIIRMRSYLLMTATCSLQFEVQAQVQSSGEIIFKDVHYG